MEFLEEDNRTVKSVKLVTDVLGFFSSLYDDADYDEMHEYNDILGLLYNYLTNDDALEYLENLVDLTFNAEVTIDDFYGYIERYSPFTRKQLEDKIHTLPRKEQKYEQLLKRINEL